MSDAQPDLATNEAREQAGPCRGRILLVEDDAMVRLVTEKGLRALGYDVLVAENGQAALDMDIDLERIDLVISDVVMPGMNGFELASHLRRRRADLNLLFVSGYSDHIAENEDGHVHETRDVYLKKPYTVSELARRAARLIDGDTADSEST